MCACFCKKGNTRPGCGITSTGGRYHVPIAGQRLLPGKDWRRIAYALRADYHDAHRARLGGGGHYLRGDDRDWVSSVEILLKRAKKYPGEKSPGVVSSYHQSVQPLVNAVFLQQLIPECRIIQSTLRICNTLIFQKMSC